jgi:sporulation protein YlmC with PRC-barrel domain
MRLKDLIGKNHIDSAGDDLGKIEAIVYDWDAKKLQH